MIVRYKGFKIEARREKCLAGYSLLYCTAYREGDGREFICDYHDGAETIRSIIDQVKGRIDDYLSHPEEDEDIEEDGQRDQECR